DEARCAFRSSCLREIRHVHRETVMSHLAIDHGYADFLSLVAHECADVLLVSGSHPREKACGRDLAIECAERQIAIDESLESSEQMTVAGSKDLRVGTLRKAEVLLIPPTDAVA